MDNCSNFSLLEKDEILGKWISVTELKVCLGIKNSKMGGCDGFVGEMVSMVAWYSEALKSLLDVVWQEESVPRNEGKD